MALFAYHTLVRGNTTGYESIFRCFIEEINYPRSRAVSRARSMKNDSLRRVNE